MATLAARVLSGVFATMFLAAPAVAAGSHPPRAVRHSSTHVRHNTVQHRVRAFHIRHLASPTQPTATGEMQAAAPVIEGGLIHNAAFIDNGLPFGQPRWSQTGAASWYGGGRWDGQMTSSGARYDQDQLTAAHASLPIGSRVRVTMVHSMRSVVVVITDRPGTHRRIIDLSRAAAAALGMLDAGVANVTLTPG